MHYEKLQKGFYTLMHYVRTLSFTSNFFSVSLENHLMKEPEAILIISKTFYLQINPIKQKWFLIMTETYFADYKELQYVTEEHSILRI